MSSANSHFEVLSNSVPEKNLNATLVALERAYEKLDEHLSASERTIRIKIRLFESRDEYQQYTNDRSLGTTRCSCEAPQIALPAWQAEDSVGGQPTALTPKHEMVHAVVCMIAGTDTIPRWFQEGLAQYETLKGMDWLVTRVSLRLYLWGERDKIPTQDALVSYTPDSAGEEAEAVFYATSFEFMRYLARCLKGNSPWTIVHQVSSGSSLDDCLEDATGHGFAELYGQWQQSLGGKGIL